MILYMEWWKEPFFQVPLAIMVSFAFATWFQSKFIDDLKDAISKRLDSIEQRLVSMESLIKSLTGLGRPEGRPAAMIGRPTRKQTALRAE